MIIGITGKKRAGKDTVAAYLVERYDFERMAFADRLKQAIANLFDIPVAEVDALKKSGEWEDVILRRSLDAENTYTWREFLQRFGTEMGRYTFGEDFWVNQFWANAPMDCHLAIPDCRFENEAHSIVWRRGYIIEVLRPESGIADEEDEHESEKRLPLSMISYQIMNDGTIEDLRRKVDHTMNLLKGKVT